ncbi:MAG: hypothetical protein L3J63_04965 [Geopsychrobacter sp.]|nr:hypothetical protein [Geopsychrobacter sp.]
MKSAIQGCFGCGEPIESSSRFCPHCSEIVEFETYNQPDEKNRKRQKNQKRARKQTKILGTFLFPSPLALACLTVFLVIAAAVSGQQGWVPGCSVTACNPEVDTSSKTPLT